MLKQMIRRLFGTNKERRVKARPRRFQPRLEAFEDRLVPATTWEWTGGWSGAPNDWGTLYNWRDSANHNTHGVPAAGDSIVFDGNIANVDCTRHISSTSATDFASVTIQNGYTRTISLGGDSDHNHFTWGRLLLES